MTRLHYSFVLLLLLTLLPAKIGHAAPFTVIKSTSSDTVYYVDSNDARHPFPNKATYATWYGNDFSEVVTVSDELIATFPLGSNIPIRSGNIVKVPSSPIAYAVEPGGVLRAIETEELAALFFGSNWAENVIDVPEVFFVNYSTGKPIESSSDVPNGIVYQITGEDTLYWKDRDLLTRFADEDAITANRFGNVTRVQNGRSYFTRNHVISETESSLFNPAVSAAMSTADCSAERLRAGMVYLHEGAFDDTDLTNLAMIKNDFPNYWYERSNTFSNITFPFPLHLMDVTDENRIVNENNRFEVTHEVGFDYFDSFSDTVDFLVVFTDFPVGDENKAFFSPITQSIEGIGKQRLDRSAIFGSGGKLKGIVVMGDLANFSFNEQRRVDSLFNTLAHELLHNWSGELRFINGSGNISDALLAEDKRHWTPWTGFTSPVGGKGWQRIGNDTFGVDPTLSTNLARDFHELDLYTMGLLPPQVVDPVGYIVTSEPEPLGQTTSNPMATVTIDQILEANGPYRCVLPTL